MIINLCFFLVPRLLNCRLPGMATEKPSLKILCCFCNPFWSPEDEYIVVGSDTSGEEYIVNEKCSTAVATPTATTTKLEEEKEEENSANQRYALISDSFKAYYKAFPNLGRDAIFNGLITKGSYDEAVARLSGGSTRKRGEVTLDDDFLLLRRVIARCQSHAVQAYMISGYELYKDCYTQLFGKNGDDEGDARIALLNAMNIHKSINDRILSYQKAIYYTHELREKNRIKSQYDAFYDRKYVPDM
jgi:hypothetical protein